MIILLNENLNSVVLPNGFTIANPNLPTRVCKTTRTHIDNVLTENVAEDRGYVFESPFKTEHFGSVLFIGVSVEKPKKAP